MCAVCVIIDSDVITVDDQRYSHSFDVIDIDDSTNDNNSKTCHSNSIDYVVIDTISKQQSVINDVVDESDGDDDDHLSEQQRCNVVNDSVNEYRRGDSHDS